MYVIVDNDNGGIGTSASAGGVKYGEGTSGCGFNKEGKDVGYATASGMCDVGRGRFDDFKATFVDVNLGSEGNVGQETYVDIGVEEYITEKEVDEENEEYDEVNVEFLYDADDLELQEAREVLKQAAEGNGKFKRGSELEANNYKKQQDNAAQGK